MSEEYYSVLARTISAAAEDHAQLRGLIYRLARIELKKQLHRQYRLELQQQMAALENAIAKVETDFIEDRALPHLSAEVIVDPISDSKSASNALTVWQDPQSSTLDAAKYDVISPSTYPTPYPDWFQSNRNQRDGASRDHRSATKRARSSFWWPVRLAAVALIGVAIYLLGQMQGGLGNAVDHYAHLSAGLGNPTEAGSEHAMANAPVAPRTIDGVPLPTSYGVYAIDRGRLTNLGSFPIIVPDPRIAISAIISTPSRTALPDGRAKFVVFRRDLVNNAPDRASVRIVAQVMRALIFVRGGAAKTVDVDGKWAVRDKSFDMSVSPVPGNPEMVVIRPQNAQFSFPAGRYALVFGRAAYDFSIDGSVTDPAQCLERTDGLDVALYSECRKL